MSNFEAIAARAGVALGVSPVAGAKLRLGPPRRRRRVGLPSPAEVRETFTRMVGFGPRAVLRQGDPTLG